MRYLIILFIAFTSYQLSAQRPVAERIKAEKIGHITTTLNLSSSEATTFWPVYNKYEELRETNRRALRSFFMRENTDEGSLDNYLALKAEETKIEADMVADLNEVISEEKILALLRAEQSFKRELMRKVKRKFKDRRGNR